MGRHDRPRLARAPHPSTAQRTALQLSTKLFLTPAPQPHWPRPQAPSPARAALACGGERLPAHGRLHGEKGGEVEQRVVRKLVDRSLDGRGGAVAKGARDGAAPAPGGWWGAQVLVTS